MSRRVWSSPDARFSDRGTVTITDNIRSGAFWQKLAGSRKTRAPAMAGALWKGKRVGLRACMPATACTARLSPAVGPTANQRRGSASPALVWGRSGGAASPCPATGREAVSTWKEQDLQTQQADHQRITSLGGQDRREITAVERPGPVLAAFQTSCSRALARRPFPRPPLGQSARRRAAGRAIALTRLLFLGLKRRRRTSVCAFSCPSLPICPELPALPYANSPAPPSSNNSASPSQSSPLLYSLPLNSLTSLVSPRYVLHDTSASAPAHILSCSSHPRSRP